MEEEVMLLMDEEEPEDVRQGKFMTFKVGSDVFGIELKYVNEIIQIQPIAPIPEVEPFIKGLINLRGKIIPVIDVATRFGKPEFEYNDRTCVIVIEVQNVEVGLIIETIAEVVSIEDDDILPPPVMTHNATSKEASQNRFIRGIGKTCDGVKLLLDPVKLLSDDALEFAHHEENEEEE